jgi:hypothetical protein
MVSTFINGFIQNIQNVIYYFEKGIINMMEIESFPRKLDTSSKILMKR